MDDYRTSPILVALAATLVAALLFAAGDACEGVPSMSVEAACRAASGTDARMHSVCLRTLHASTPPDHKVSTYAAMAAQAAAVAYDRTAKGIDALLQGRLNHTHREMLTGCDGDIRTAHLAIATVEGQLRRCVFEHLAVGYSNAIAATEHCIERTVSLGETHVQLMAKGAKYRTVLSSRLGASLRV